MTKRKPLPSAEYLRTILTYEPSTGLLRWKIDRGCKKIGDIAGSRRGPDGYVQIGIDYRLCRAHLVAWKIVTGCEPPAFLDHKNTVKHDNRWDNLREATKSQNQANIGLISTNKSGLKGVSRYRAGESYGKPWQASIAKDGKSQHLGHFSTKKEAHRAYCEAAKKNFGKFARAK